jgi:hypothetical protein
MCKVYIVLTYSGTVLSNIVKIYTKKDYSHVSISLDKDLNQMYSFGRHNAYIAFWGGFVHESPKFGTFKRFKKTKTKVYSLDVSKKQYNKITKIINEFDLNKEKYSFNIIGLFAVALHLRVKINRSYYCAEFVKYVLDNALVKTNLPDIVKPNDFEKIEGIELIYKGALNKYLI